jgi:cytochrome c-type biogenesis protein CcmE
MKMAMPPKRKQRLMIVLSIVMGASIAAGLVFYALSDNLDLFSPPSDIVAGKVPVGKQMRAGGMVEKDSVIREKDSLTVRFNITDYQETVTVSYTGILPDLFSEDSGVVVTGVLQEDGTITASQVLAKHDENYMPPEVAATLKKQHATPNATAVKKPTE